MDRNMPTTEYGNVIGALYGCPHTHTTYSGYIDLCVFPLIMNEWSRCVVGVVMLMLSALLCLQERIQYRSPEALYQAS